MSDRRDVSGKEGQITQAGFLPKNSVSFIAKKIKGNASRVLRQEFPHLKDWCRDYLWTPSCYHSSVGNGWDVVERYISAHKYEYNK